MDEIMQARMKKLEKELEEYKQAICDAQDALDTAERELTAALEDRLEEG